MGKNRDELRRLAGERKRFKPEMSEDDRSRALGGWKKAVKACRIFTEEE